MRAIAELARSDVGEKFKNSPIRMVVSAYRRGASLGSDRWRVWQRREDMLGIP